MESEPPEALSPQTLPITEPSVMKLTRGHSCVLCQQRKVRCDKNKPCANCVKAQAECRVVPPQPPRRRKKKPQERELVERLKKYEALLSENGVNFEPIAHQLKHSEPGAVDEVAELEQDLGELKTSPSATTAADLASSDHGHPLEKRKWFPHFQEYRIAERILRDSSDDDFEGSTIHRAWDTMYGDADGFPFMVGGGNSSVTDLHPPAIQIFQLWQVYINNVNPLLKISHIPTLQGQIIEAGANPTKIPEGLEALMFGIYFTAVLSLPEEEVQNRFDEDKNVLMARFHAATQQALINAKFMSSTDIMVLQGYLLYLLAVRHYMDPRSLFCMIGIAVRVATRMGLHRDGAQYTLSPFEVEQRRRLWWQIVIFDKRVAEMTGSTVTALSTSGGDAKLPLNINDGDLSVHAKDPPTPYSGPTEMIFVLTRLDLTTAAATNFFPRCQPTPTASGGPAPGKPRFQHNTFPSCPAVATNVALQNLPPDLDAYCASVENTYLKHCDAKIPLHFFTLLMTRQTLCKLRVIAFLCRSVPTETLDAATRDGLFLDAIRTVEYDNLTLGSDMLRGFVWYTWMHFPFPAYMFLVSELRHRRTGELVERAWQAICENHDRRGLIRHRKSPMHIAFGHLFVKAWDAREAAETQLGRAVTAPRLIVVLRQRIKKYGGGRAARTAGGGDDTGSSPSAAANGATTTTTAGGGDFPMPQPGAGVGVPDHPHPLGVNVGVDDSAMFAAAFDGMNPLFGSTGNNEVDFGQMDWSYLMPQLGGFGGMFAQSGGMPGSHWGP